MTSTLIATNKWSDRTTSSKNDLRIEITSGSGETVCMFWFRRRWLFYLFVNVYILSALELGPTRFPPIPVTTLT